MTADDNNEVLSQPVETVDSLEKRTFIQRLCFCCYPDNSKEPPVQLIRSGSLTYERPAEAQPVATTARESNEGLEEVNLETPTAPKPIPSPRSKKEDDINVNDFVVDDILGEEDKTESIVEDAVSIPSNVVEEVNQEDLQSALKTEENNGHYKLEKSTDYSDTDSDDEESLTAEEVSTPKSRPPSLGSVHEVLQKTDEISHADYIPEDIAEEVMLDPFEDPSPQLVRSPPPVPSTSPPTLSEASQSKMYADADESSDEEEDAPPVAPSRQSRASAEPKSIDRDSDSTEKSSSESESENVGFEKENTGVTRISLKSNGNISIHQPMSPARTQNTKKDDEHITTDDEFAEKLI